MKTGWSCYKRTLVIEKNFWISRLKAEIFQNLQEKLDKLMLCPSMGPKWFSNALYFYGSKLILDHPSHFGWVQIVLDGSNLFGRVQIILDGSKL